MESPAAEPLAILNGTAVPFREATLPIFDLGIVQGATLTERLRTFRQQPFQVQEHLSRLQDSLNRLEWMSVSVDSLRREIEIVVRHNSQYSQPGDDLSVVIFVTGGDFTPDANGLRFSDRGYTTCVYTAPLPLTKYADWYAHGIPLVMPSVRQIPAASLDPRLKTRSRMHWYLADREARQRNQQAMALLLDSRGYVTETSSGNLFVIQKGRLLTPRAEQTLGGIAQRFVIELAEGLGFPVERCDLLPEDVSQNSAEAFLTSSTYCIAPVCSLNGLSIGNSIPGPITSALQAAWGQRIEFDFVRSATGK